MFLRICFGLLVFFAYKGYKLGVASHGHVYVLYPGLRSWNEVQELCSRAGFGMLKIKSGRDSVEFLQYIKEWNNGGALDYDIWMGLYDKLQRKKRVKYQWNDCTAFGSYRPWAGSEPDHKDTEHCVRISTSGVFRTMTCGEHYHTVCQQNVRCWFYEKKVDVSKYTQMAPRSSTRFKCKQDCLNRHEEGNMCVAYRHSSGECRIYLKSPSGPAPATSPVKRKVALKQCYRGYINSTFPFVPENKDDFANDPCDPDTTTSSSTTTWSPSIVYTTETSSLSSDTTTVTSPGASTSTATTHTTSAVSPAAPTFHKSVASIVSVTIAGTSATASATTTSVTTVKTTATTPAAATFIASVTTATTTASATTDAAAASTTPNFTTSAAASTTASTTPTMPTTSPPTTSPVEKRKDAVGVVSPWQHCHVTGTCQEVCIRVDGLYTLDVMAMLEQLLLEKNILSSHRRSKISIPDHRPSAVSIGMVGICILVGFVVSVVFMDIVKYAS